MVIKEWDEEAFHASSLRLDRFHDAEYFGNAIRNYWKIETGYHSRRDRAYCEDVRTRRRNRNVVAAMMIARTAGMFFFANSGSNNAEAFKEHMQRNPRKVLRCVLSRTHV